MPLPLSLSLADPLGAMCALFVHRYAIQLMIAKQLSEKLKEARLSQRRAESALADALETQQPDGTSGSGSASASSSSSSGTNAATAGLAACGREDGSSVQKMPGVLPRAAISLFPFSP